MFCFLAVQDYFSLFVLYRIHKAGPDQRERLREKVLRRAAALRTTAVTPKTSIRTTAAPLQASPALNRAMRATRTPLPIQTGSQQRVVLRLLHWMTHRSFKPSPLRTFPFLQNLHKAPQLNQLRAPVRPP